MLEQGCYFLLWKCLRQLRDNIITGNYFCIHCLIVSALKTWINKAEQVKVSSRIRINNLLCLWFKSLRKVWTNTSVESEQMRALAVSTVHSPQCLCRYRLVKTSPGAGSNVDGQVRPLHPTTDSFFFFLIPATTIHLCEPRRLKLNLL